MCVQPLKTSPGGGNGKGQGDKIGRVRTMYKFDNLYQYTPQ